MTFRLALVTLAGVLAGACKDSVGVADFNPAMTGQKVDGAVSSLSSNPAVQSMNVMSNAFTFSGAPPVPLSATLSAARSAGRDRSAFAALEALGRATALLSPASPEALFPSAAVGKTFVYNSQTGKYQSSDLAGAPANGVRYLLYAVDHSGGSVIIPLQQIGTLDLTDKSTPAANTVGIQAVVNNVTVLSYDASGAISGGNFTFGAKGYVSDGTARLNFDLSQSFSTSTGLKIDYKVTAQTVALEVVANTTSLGAGTVTLTITEGKDQMEVAITGNAQSSAGTVKYNGSTLANITVIGDQDPVFTGAGGRVLSADDLAGLKSIFLQVNTIFDRFDDLLVPSYFVFGL